MRTFLPLLVLLAACGSDGNGTETDSDTDTVASAPTFTEVRSAVFPGCSVQSCHGSNAGELTLADDMSASALVNMESFGAPGQILVIPGDPDNSYLVKKIEGAATIVGDPMPPPFGGVPAEQVEMVRAWIAAGAEDN